jgi:hypothetical protein
LGIGGEQHCYAEPKQSMNHVFSHLVQPLETILIDNIKEIGSEAKPNVCAN